METNEIQLKRSNYELNQELLHYFLNYLLSLEKKNPKTILNVKRDIELYLRFLYENNDALIEYKTIILFLDYIEEKYRESSYITKASSLRQFINWLNLEENPFWKIKISVNYEDFKFYNLEEIFTKSEEKFDYSNLLVRVLYELYLSIDELSELRVSDYNLASEKFSIRGVNFKVSEELATAMKFYLKDFREKISQLTTNLNDPLFINSKADQLKTLDVINILRERSFKNIYLKRSRIIHLLEEGKSQSEIESLLGIKLSKFYSPFVKEKDYRLLSAYNQFHPRA